MKPGETREIQVTFPEDYHAKDVAGKPATFEIVAKKLQKPVLPVIDDAFAKKIGFDSLSELREALSGQMQREYDQIARL
jgi:trigger factor